MLFSDNSLKKPISNMNSITFLSLISSTLLCINAFPANYENGLSVPSDLNTAETIWDLFKDGGSRGYSGWGTGVQASAVPAVQVYPVGAGYQTYQPIQASPVPAVQTYPSYPSYVSYPNYGGYENTGSYGSYGKYPSIYSKFGSSFPSYENYGVHGGHGFGKYGKY